MRNSRKHRVEKSASNLAISTGTGNVCIGSNCNIYSGNCIGSIVLGSRVNSSSPNVVNTANNQLYISPIITSFNISGLIPSTGSGGNYVRV